MRSAIAYGMLAAEIGATDSLTHQAFPDSSMMKMRPLSRRLRPLEEGLFVMTVALGGVFLTLELFDGALYFTVSEPSYLILHSLLEIASILVSFAVFIVNWEASKQSRNAQSLFVATGFLAVAAADVMHTLSYNGMPAFVTPNTVEKAIYFWLFARYWAAGTLLASGFVRPDSEGWYLSRYFLAAVSLVACAILFAAVMLVPSALPRMYEDGKGLTQLKTSAEYGAVALSLLAALVIARRYRVSRDGSLIVLVAALVVGAFSELSLTLYRSPYDVYNLLGHAYKVVAYYLIFRALLVSSVERPYIQLRRANEDLERTVAKLDARTRELDALDEVALTLTSSLRPEELLPSAIEKVMSVMRAEAGAILMADEESGYLRLEAWKGLKAGLVAQWQAHPPPLPRHGVASPSFSHRETGGETASVRPLAGSYPRVAPMGYCVCAPVSNKGKTQGSICMFAREGRTFTTGDANLLEAVGVQLGLAIENARLYEQTDERLRENVLDLQRAERKARFLADAAALLAGSMELRRVLELVARKSTEVIGDWCAIYLLERDNALNLAAVYHSDEEELIAIQRLFGRRPLRAGEGLIGGVAETGEAMLVAGEMVQEFASSLQSMVESVEEIAMVHRVLPSSAIVAPMRARGRTVGVLVVMETHTAATMGEAELALVTELGDRAGVAIENSQLFQESQEQRQHIEAVISQMVDGVVITDAGGEVRVANRAAEAMLGGQFGLLVGDVAQADRPLGVFDEAKGGTPLIRRALSGQALTGEEILVAGEASERVLSASVTPVREQSGEISGAVAVLRDVTAEREVERMKDEFVAIVSHELRTPITAVLGYTDLLLRGLRGPMTPAQTDALTSVRSAGSRLFNLIEDVLDISKLEAGKQDLLVDLVGVQSAVDRALASIAFMANSKRVRLVQSVPRSVPPVLADDGQLQRILGNLLSNAVKFTPEGGTVTVSAIPSGEDGRPIRAIGGRTRKPQWVSIRVTDTGLGIPPQMQERIWEKFQQADSSSSRAFGGTGLGLAITKALVGLHGGRVWVESEGVPGSGSSFGFTLPAA